jgi:hypothetical protein
MPGMSDTRPSILGTPKSISTNIFQFKPSIEWGTPILGYRRNTQSNKQISLGAPSCSGQGPFLLMNVSFPTVMASHTNYVCTEINPFLWFMYNPIEIASYKQL